MKDQQPYLTRTELHREIARALTKRDKDTSDFRALKYIASEILAPQNIPHYSPSQPKYKESRKSVYSYLP